jgi:hypothetical protein
MMAMEHKPFIYRKLLQQVNKKRRLINRLFNAIL